MSSRWGKERKVLGWELWKEMKSSPLEWKEFLVSVSK
jgi:hypothetical protein